MPYINAPSSGGGTGAGKEIAYSQITASVNVASTTEATGTTIISPGAVVFDGAPVICEFFACRIATPDVTVINTSNFVVVSLFEGATQISRLAFIFINENIGAGGVALQAPVYGALRFTPTAASHTYTITAFASSATGPPSVFAGAGGTATDSPAFVRFTKV